MWKPSKRAPCSCGKGRLRLIPTSFSNLFYLFLPFPLPSIPFLSYFFFSFLSLFFFFFLDSLSVRLFNLLDKFESQSGHPSLYFLFSSFFFGLFLSLWLTLSFFDPSFFFHLSFVSHYCILKIVALTLSLFNHSLAFSLVVWGGDCC